MVGLPEEWRLRSLALANQKGGVGKTTSAVHLAHGLALAGQDVVLLDLDPQANATIAVQAMVTRTDPQDQLFQVCDGLWLVPSPGIRGVADSSTPNIQHLQGFRRELEQEGVDWLIVDCPPRLDEWGNAGIGLCHEVLVPVQCEFFAMHGLSRMIATLSTGSEPRGNPTIRGVLITMADLREPIAHEVLRDLRSTLGDTVLDTVIHRDASFVEAASHGRTVFDYDIYAKGARAYGELVREILYG